MQLPHVASGKVEILTSEQVGNIFLMKEDDPQYAAVILHYYVFNF